MVVAIEKEDPDIRLVHLLMTCAGSMQRGDIPLVGSLTKDVQRVATLEKSLDTSSMP